MSRFWFVLLVMMLPSVLRADIFTSVQHMTQVFAVERKVVDALSHYISKTEAKLDVIKRYLENYEPVKAESKSVPNAFDLASKDVKDVTEERLAGNPLHAYQLMKRLTIDWKNIKNYDPQLDWRDVESALVTGDVFGFSELANEEDLKGAAQALVRLQSVYHLNTTDLVTGIISGTQTSAELDAQDCLYMGKHSYNLGLYYNAIQWFEQAFTLARSKINQVVTENQISSFIEAAHTAYDKSKETRRANDTNEEYDRKVHKLSLIRSKQYEIAKKKFKIGSELTDVDNYVNFETLCRGEQLLNETYLAKLKCYFDDRDSSYLTLMPAKVEERHVDPQIVMFHDVITDREIEILKQYTRNQLSRAKVRGGQDHSDIVSSTRISKVAWLDNSTELGNFSRMTHRMQALTGLDISVPAAENLQISNYGIGGHYNPHRDYIFTEEERYQEKSLKVGGDRIATFMFYLSDVEKGGATAFPEIGVSLFPQKGSAAFWYNLKRNGYSETRSLHGGCPVLFGSKWVANKWIRLPKQFKNRPCSLNATE